MATREHDELLGMIAELRKMFPEWPLGQMITTLAMAVHGSKPKVVWDTTDEDMLSAARRLLALHEKLDQWGGKWDHVALKQLPAHERDALLADSAAFAVADYVNDPELTAFE